MDSLETGKDKIQKICEILKAESIEPAREESAKLISEAQRRAQRIIEEAEKKGEELITLARQKIGEEQRLFQHSLTHACAQGIESLKQEIEKKFFNESLASFVEKETVDPEVGKKMITALVQAVEKEGISVDFSAVVAKTVSAKEVGVLLAREILEKLKNKTVEVGEFRGGVQLKLHDRKLTLDLSDQAIKELLGKYLRKDFRDIVFT